MWIGKVESLKMIKIKINNKINKFKQKLNEYFLFNKSMINLMNFSKKFYIFSIGFDDVYHRIKNPKRFKIIIIICILMWLTTFYHLMLLISDDLYSLLDGPFLPDHFRTWISFILIILFLVAFIRTDIMLDEIKFGLQPLEVFYFLMMNLKQKHKLTNSNYKKLAILSRIIQMLILNYVAPILSFLLIFIFVKIMLISKSLAWILQIIFITPFYLVSVVTITSCCCVVYIYYSYYKLLFDQINHQIQSILSHNKTKVINSKMEKQLIYCMNQHNLASIEIHTMNLSIRSTAAIMFITFSLIKIISLYLIMNMKHTLMKVLMANVFIAFFIFGFGLSILYSLQIKSAHQSHQFIHSIVCKYRMRLTLKLKVIK